MDTFNAIVGSIIAKVAEYTVAPVERQLGYIIFYRKNLDDLDGKRRDLNGVREKVQNMVNMARSKYFKIRDDVEHWLEEAEKIIEPKVSEDKMSPSCFNLIQRHKLGRKAKKMIEEINEIIEKTNTFDEVGYPLPLPTIDSSSIPGYQSIASRMSTAKVIMDALADTKSRMVGIYGMGGVGKTMLVMEVARLLKEQTLFDSVITVTIGQSIDVKGIQEKIKETLRLTFTEETVEARAKLLLNNLKTMENKILIVVDDLWNKLKLEDVGIPCGCKILITSRDKDVLTNEMGVKTNFIFELKSLSETEAWEFFKNRIGEIDKISIEPTAIKVAKKCGGLPIALVTVGETLKGKNLHIWKDALKQLQNPTTVKIKGVTTEVYGSLRLSYDFIQNDEAKLIFLLCSVFPDDYEIDLKKLSMYAMGMRLLNGVNTLEEARDRMEALVDVLKSSSLLLEFDNYGMKYVKMHDVVRDVAIHISSEEGSQMSTLCRSRRYEGSTEWRDKCGSYRAIYANCADFNDLPQDLKFPKLELLILIGGSERKELHQTFFAGMEQLKVLDLSRMHVPEELPETMSQLTKLKVLKMHACDNVRYMFPCSAMTTLVSLEVLIILGCKSLEAIFEMEEDDGYIVKENDVPLPKLSYVSLKRCRKLKSVFPAPIKRLPRLETLECYDGVPCELLLLESNSSLFHEVVFPSLRRVKMSFTTMKRNIMSRSEWFPELKHLYIIDFNREVDDFDVDWMRLPLGYRQILCRLEELEIHSFTKWKMFFDYNLELPSSFSNLKSLSIIGCRELKNLINSSVVKRLVKLEKLFVINCNGMISILDGEEEEEEEIIFNKLVVMEFYLLRKLESFHFGKSKIIFPCLEKLTIRCCNVMKIFSNGIVSAPKIQYLSINKECLPTTDINSVFKKKP